MAAPRKFFYGVDTVGAKVVNLADPTNPGDAVNLQYLANYVRGLRFKDPARAATTANLNLAAPGASIDGVALAVGDRILVKNQTVPSENGLYAWNGANATLTRTQDADTAAELASAVVIVAEGTSTDATGALANADRAWLQRTDAITIGSTALSWIPLPGAGTNYGAGDGLGLSGVTFRVVAAAGGGLVVGPSGVGLDTGVAVRKYAANVGGATSIAVAHALGTTDVTVSVRDNATGELVDPSIVVTDANTVTLGFLTAPAAAAYRVVVHG